MRGILGCAHRELLALKDSEGESRQSIRTACGGVSLMYQYSHCLALPHDDGEGAEGVVDGWMRGDGGGGWGYDSRAQERGERKA